MCCRKTFTSVCFAPLASCCKYWPNWACRISMLGKLVANGALPLVERAWFSVSMRSASIRQEKSIRAKNIKPKLVYLPCGKCGFSGGVRKVFGSSISCRQSSSRTGMFLPNSRANRCFRFERSFPSSIPLAKPVWCPAIAKANSLPSGRNCGPMILTMWSTTTLAPAVA